MRKIFSILCFLLFLAGLPGLFTGIMRSSNFGFIIGLAILPAFCLFASIVFWKPGPNKQSDRKEGSPHATSPAVTDQNENTP